VAQAVDLVVDRGVLVDVGVALLDVGLGLVVVVEETKYSTALSGKRLRSS